MTSSEHDNSTLLKIDASDFEVEVLKSEQPVLVMFATRWSSSCQTLEPVMDEIARSCENELRVVWVNADENPDLGLWYGIQAVPTLLYFEAGEIRCRIVGTATKAAILSKLDAISGDSTNQRRSRNA